jgi:hypothetical protein
MTLIRHFSFIARWARNTGRAPTELSNARSQSAYAYIYYQAMGATSAVTSCNWFAVTSRRCSPRRSGARSPTAMCPSTPGLASCARPAFRRTCWPARTAAPVRIATTSPGIPSAAANTLCASAGLARFDGRRSSRYPNTRSRRDRRRDPRWTSPAPRMTRESAR